MQKTKSLETSGPKCKKEKRKQYNQLMRTMFAFREGSAYLPEEAYLSILRAVSELKHAQQICRSWWKSA